jgi:hypothetical protein
MVQFNYDSGVKKAIQAASELYGDMLTEAIIEIDNINRSVGNELGEGELAKIGLHAQSKLMNSEILEAWTSILAGPDNTRDDIADMLFVAAGYLARYSRDISVAVEVGSWLLNECIERVLIDASVLDGGSCKYSRLAAISHLSDFVAHYHDDYIIPYEDEYNVMMTTTRNMMVELIYSILNYACAEVEDITEREMIIDRTVSDLNKVIESNKTKFCKTADEANATIRKYEKLGVTTHAEESSLGYVIKSSVTVTGKDGKQYPEGKWLKGINFVDAEFDVRDGEKY